jgi:fibronectin type 3 domain-containing protein
MCKFYTRWCRSVFGLLLAFALLACVCAFAQVAPAGTAHSVTLAWVAPSPVGGSGTISGYNVYRSPSSSTTYAKLNSTVNAGLTYTDTSVAAGTGYSYCVTTVDSLGEESVCSVPATANVPANPNAPSGLVVTVK